MPWYKIQFSKWYYGTMVLYRCRWWQKVEGGRLLDKPSGKAERNVFLP